MVTLTAEEEAFERELARQQGIPEDEYLWVMSMVDNDVPIPEDQKPEWLKQREAEFDEWMATPEAQERIKRHEEEFLAYVKARESSKLAVT